jgi:hypothetical protein
VVSRQKPGANTPNAASCRCFSLFWSSAVPKASETGEIGVGIAGIGDRMPLVEKVGIDW